MRLTRTSTPPNSACNDAFPTTQLFVLALCRLAEPIALTSIFPYSWPMVKSFHIGDSKDASFYAGVLIASFALAESLTTLVGRVLGGALNGNIGVIQTMVAELVSNPQHEPKAYAIMPFVWSIGTIVGPAIGGMLANPVKSFPDFFSKSGFFGRFPWLLPNLVCAAFMFISIVAGYLFLQETHPQFISAINDTEPPRLTEQTPFIRAAGANADQEIDLRRGSFGTFNNVDVSRNTRWIVNADGSSRPASMFEKQLDSGWLDRKIVMLIIALGLFTYHSMCYDQLLPIFFQDDRVEEVSALASGALHVPGGLGLSTKTVGAILSVNGLIALFIQAVIFPLCTQLLGVWRVFVVVTVLHPIAYFMVPYLTFLSPNLLFPGIYVCLTVRNLFSILEYPVLLILLKQASPSPSVLGRINGLAAAAGAACRTIAPPVAGLLYGWGTDVSFTGLAWWGAGLVALVAAFQIVAIPRDRDSSATVKSFAPCFQRTPQDQIHDHVYVEVCDSEMP